MKTIDLHSHTTASDGAYSPMALIDLAKQVGLDMLAITDHDTIQGFAEGVSYAQMAGIHLISGVEVSTQHTLVGGGYGVRQDLTKSIHVVGLNFSNTSKMKQALLVIQESRAKRGWAMVEKMSQLLLADTQLLAKCPTTDDVQATLWRAVLTKASNPLAVGRPHLASVLCEWGIVENIPKAFDKYLADNKPAYVPLACLSMAQAITLIHDCGGVAVLAHPTRYGLSATRIRRLIDEFAQLGGDGCELPANSEPIGTRTMVDRAIAKNNLLVSVGSDFHGSIMPWRKLGQVPRPGIGQVGVWEHFS